MFGATNMAKNSDKSKWVYSGYEIAFDRKGECNFGNASAKNAVVLVLIIVHHLILIITKIIFLELAERDTFGINQSFGTTEKKFSIIF